MKKIVNLIKKFFYQSQNLILIGAVYAAEDNATINLKPIEGGGFNTLGDINLADIVPVVIQIILIVAALVALIFLIVGGIKWIISGGDKTNVEAARGTITNALIGLFIVFAAWAIVKLIEYLFGLDIMQLNIPKIGGE